MTTREEFALAFAVSAYGQIMETRLNRQMPTGLTEEEQMNRLDKLDRETIKGAVEMADLLIDELTKEKAPPVKPTR